jgi:hypothetical protein
VNTATGEILDDDGPELSGPPDGGLNGEN